MQTCVFQIRLSPRAIIRVACAIVLLFAVLATTLPSSVFSAMVSCSMGCCKGLPSHSGTPCAGGVCHARIKPRTKKPVEFTSNDPICGLHKTKKKVDAELFKSLLKTDFISLAKQQDSDKSNNQSSSSHTIQQVSKQSCKEDCGCGVSVSTNRNIKDKKQALSFAQRQRPPTIKLFDKRVHFAYKSLTLNEKIRPRAPPIFFF